MCFVECRALQIGKTINYMYRRMQKMELYKSIVAIDKNLLNLKNELLQICDDIHNIRLALNELCGFPVENAENVFKKVSFSGALGVTGAAVRNHCSRPCNVLSKPYQPLLIKIDNRSSIFNVIIYV